MKLLGWMHRKSKDNNNNSLKSFSTDKPAYFTQTSFDDLSQHGFSYALSRESNTNCQYQLADNNAKEEPCSEVFQGFLAIGTLGVEPLNTEPATPTFPDPSEHITHEDVDITENDLKLINDKLEKFLEAEAKEVIEKTSERNSNASIVTICNNQIEDTNAEDNGNILMCPLQKYLFGSSGELYKTGVQTKRKTSLEELFKRNTVHEHHGEKYENEEKQLKEKHATGFMKKMLKKLHSTSRTSRAPSNEDTGHTALSKRKLPKVLKIFHSRVHPEESMAEKKASHCNKMKKIFGKCGYQEGECEGIETLPPRAHPTKEINSGVTSTKTGGHWIKTDAQYLVLEL